MPSITVEDDDNDNKVNNYDDIDDLDYDLPAAPPAASGSSTGRGAPSSLLTQQHPLLGSVAGRSGPSSNPRMISDADAAKFKHYQILYPIYVDVKRPHRAGERRVSKGKAVNFPQAREMAEACGRLFGLSPLYEPEKTHPRDWDNPGRIRVLLKDASRKPFNPSVPDKYALLNKMGEAIRILRTSSGLKLSASITSRLPAHSPAVSFGTLEEALKGGGKMAEMMKGMLGGVAPGQPRGGTASDEEIKRIQEEKDLAEKQKIAKMKALQKQGRRMVVRR